MEGRARAGKNGENGRCLKNVDKQNCSAYKNSRTYILLKVRRRGDGGKEEKHFEKNRKQTLGFDILIALRGEKDQAGLLFLLLKRPLRYL